MAPDLPQCKTCGATASCEHDAERKLLVDYTTVAPHKTPPAGSPKAVKIRKKETHK